MSIIPALTNLKKIASYKLVSKLETIAKTDNSLNKIKQSSRNFSLEKNCAKVGEQERKNNIVVRETAGRSERKNIYAQFINTVLAKSHRGLFGLGFTLSAPDSESTNALDLTAKLPNLAKDTIAFKGEEIDSFSRLINKLDYLNFFERKLIKKAFVYANAAHAGQYRHSGQLYITHPLAVAEICANWKLDAQSIMAALLHDVVEDHGTLLNDLAKDFGPKVAELVDGLTKLDKLEFSSIEEAQAENFRKMLLAMARDVRVILVKLADRLHNMRTLNHMPTVKKRRVAIETKEIFAPIANRLGLNATFRELQDLSFYHTYPLRYKVLNKALQLARGNRREMISKILENVEKTLINAKINKRLSGREKSLYSIYNKMRDKHLSFTQVLDVYGFRIVVNSQSNCYAAVGALHALYKPMPGKFKDYIAIPKINGYQSLHTTLVGPLGIPIEFQIRTKAMHEIAEAGVAAHWLYKIGAVELNALQNRAYNWLQSLLDIQSQSGNSREFLEHIKIDLFPDAVYVFTPKSHIRALPKGATALDFAYAVHSDLGNHCVAIKINNELLPIRTELKNGDIVEIITNKHAHANPEWLRFLHSGKARSALRHYLKLMQATESIILGEQIFIQALDSINIDKHTVSSDIWSKLLNWSGAKNFDEIYTDIVMGKRLALVIAKRVEAFLSADQTRPPIANKKIKPILIDGNLGMTVIFSKCCHPIPGDNIIGCISRRDNGLAIHQHRCPRALRRHHKNPGCWVDVAWSESQGVNMFEVLIQMLVRNTHGVLARITADITNSNVNIVHIKMEEQMLTEELESLVEFTVQVSHRTHLAQLIRHLRPNRNVSKIMRKELH